LDCDPGHDDAFAILLAGHNPRINLLGISTVAGNQTVEKTTNNAQRITSVGGLSHIKIVKGQAVPLVRPSQICPEIHGESGMDCSDAFSVMLKQQTSHSADQIVNKKAVNYMFEVIDNETKYGDKVTLVATGCLTNVALLLTIYPEVKQKLDKIVILGGAIGFGNITPAAEFNILIDPEAAKIVFESGVHFVMVPLEVSHTALVTSEVIERIRDMKTPFSALCVDLLMFFMKQYKEVFGFEHPPLHDPVAVAYVINPSLFQTKFVRVDIETSSELCSGRTVCDMFGMSKKPKNVHVAEKVDVEAFWNLLLDALRSANSLSSLNTI